jgi:ATP:ADP antiporter, AAA family
MTDVFKYKKFITYLEIFFIKVFFVVFFFTKIKSYATVMVFYNFVTQLKGCCYMLKRIARTLWGDFESRAEVQKFGFLAAIFGLIIGTYWAMRPMKDSIFNAIIGMDFQPRAKWLSIIIIFPLVLLYNKLVSKYSRHHVFYFLISLYALATFGFYIAFSSPTIGLENTVKSQWRIIGWAWYVFVESFGSMIVALFWAFTTDTTKSESAKRGFPIIALFGQLGNIFGPWMLNAKFLGMKNSAPVVAICCALMLITGVLFWLFMRLTPEEELRGYEEAGKTDHPEETGFFEGLKLLFSHYYLLGMFAIIMIFEIIITIIDFHFKSSVANAFVSELEVSSYFASYGTWVGIISSICVLGGINNIQRWFGMRVSLLFLPILVIGTMIFLKFNAQSVEIAFWIMVFSKAVNYALNQPTLKQLYIPTTKDTKYKAQSWMEVFGSRGAKAIGSTVNDSIKFFKTKYGLIEGVNYFLTFSTIISFGLVGVWFVAAIYVARVYTQAIKKKELVC